MIETKFVPPKSCCTLDIQGKEQDKLVKIFKAMGNPIRFEILKFLLTHSNCITGDIVEFIPKAQSTISQHLKVLRGAGLIEGEISGPATNYCLNEKQIKKFKLLVGKIF